VKLLIDENLSRKLIARLSDLFPGSIHVTDVALEESPDAAVWEYAKVKGFTILTADADFFELATMLDRLRRFSGYAAGTILPATRKAF
jgi:predicted nuclease of predicted toxin-antitoxin system